MREPNSWVMASSHSSRMPEGFCLKRDYLSVRGWLSALAMPVLVHCICFLAMPGHRLTVAFVQCFSRCLSTSV